MNSAPRDPALTLWMNRCLVLSARLSKLTPQPYRSKLPIMIGGNGARKTLRIAAEHADIWHGFGDAAKLAELHGILDGWCAAVGREPSEIERSTRVFRKTPNEVGLDLTEVGTRLFTLVAQGPKFDTGYVRDWLCFRDDFNRGQPASSGHPSRHQPHVEPGSPAAARDR